MNSHFNRRFNVSKVIKKSSKSYNSLKLFYVSLIIILNLESFELQALHYRLDFPIKLQQIVFAQSIALDFNHQRNYSIKVSSIFLTNESGNCCQTVRWLEAALKNRRLSLAQLKINAFQYQRKVQKCAEFDLATFDWRDCSHKSKPPCRSFSFCATFDNQLSGLSHSPAREANLRAFKKH